HSLAVAAPSNLRRVSGSPRLDGIQAGRAVCGLPVFTRKHRPVTGRPSAGRLVANQRLHVAIADCLDEGLAVPCLGPAADYWLSADLEDQIMAARACRSCPAFGSCRRYTDAWPEDYGVWAGRIHDNGRVLTGAQIQH